MTWARLDVRSGEPERSHSETRTPLPLTRKAVRVAHISWAPFPRAEAVLAFVDDSVLSAARPALATLGLFFICAAIWPKPVTAGRAVMVAGSLALMTQYAWWRIADTLPAPGYTFEFALALVFLIAELVGIITSALSLIFLTRTRDRSPDADANAEWLSSLDQPPSIDVLICSYNEGREILERTIVGALGMDYPNFRVWMLDDSRRAWVQPLCVA